MIGGIAREIFKFEGLWIDAFHKKKWLQVGTASNKRAQKTVFFTFVFQSFDRFTRNFESGTFWKAPRLWNPKETAGWKREVGQ